MAQNSYAVNWFQGKALNMVFGLQLSFSRVVSGIYTIYVYIHYDWIIILHHVIHYYY